MLKTVPVTREYELGDDDLSRIRQLANNDELSADELFTFGPFVIARSGVNRNHTDITPDAQKAAVNKWIGKAILSKDHESKTENQIARIYRTALEETDGATVTKGWAYAVKTSDHADLFSRIRNGIHKEMSCAYDLVKSVCSACGSTLEGPEMMRCPQGHGIGADGVFARDVEIEPDHVSFVARPAVEGAGLIAAGAVDAATLKTFMETGKGDVPADVSGALHELRRDAEDGREFRSWAEQEFKRWFKTTNRDMTDDEIASMTDGLSAKHMMRLARIERDRFHEVIPSGEQQTTAEFEEELSEEEWRQYQNEQDILKERAKLKIWR